jgi:hypothetical protein
MMTCTHTHTLLVPLPQLEHSSTALRSCGIIEKALMRVCPF